MKIKNFEFSKNGISDSLTFIEENIKSKYNKKSINEALVVVEEYMNKFLTTKIDDISDNYFCVQIGDLFALDKISIKCKGYPINKITDEKYDLISYMEEDDFEPSIENISDWILKKYDDRVEYDNIKNVNRVVIKIKENQSAKTLKLLLAIILGILTSIVLQKFSNETVNGAILTVLNLIKDTFVKMITMVAGPLVFFSLMGSVVQYGNVSSLKRIGIKMFKYFLISLILTEIITVVFFQLFPIGVFGSQGQIESSKIGSMTITEILKNFYINLIPNNFLKSFVDGNMLQILFLSVVFGIAMSRMGEYKKTLDYMCEVLRKLFAKIVVLVTKIILIVIYATIVVLCMDTGKEGILSIGKLIVNSIILFIIVLLLELVGMGIVAKLSPIKLAKKYFSKTVFDVIAVGSSIASVPINIMFCEEEIGVSKKVSSLIIPFGASLHKPASIIIMLLPMLFLLNIYGVRMDINVLMSLFIFGISMSFVGTGTNGGAVISFTALCVQFATPNEGIAMVLPYVVLLDTFIVFVNVFPDVVVSTIIAKKENLLDEKMYNS